MSEKKQYRTWTVAQKLEIVLAGLRGDRSVAEVCREHQISENLFYTWREKLQVECPRFEGHLAAGACWALLGGSSAEVEAAVSAGVPARGR